LTPAALAEIRAAAGSFLDEQTGRIGAVGRSRADLDFIDKSVNEFVTFLGRQKPYSKVPSPEKEDAEECEREAGLVPFKSDGGAPSWSNRSQVHPMLSMPESLTAGAARAYLERFQTEHARKQGFADAMAVLQRYDDEEALAVEKALGLLSALNMNGIAPFKSYARGTFSTTSSARAFYNTK
jgi:hypothetical protein